MKKDSKKDPKFLKNTELSDLPEHLEQSGFKNVFIIDENFDFQKLGNPFKKKEEHENN